MRTVLDQNEAVDIDPAAPALRRKWPYWVAAMAGFITLGTMLLLAHSWPFTQANVIHELEQATSSNVQVGIFRQTFFPHPGCVVEKVRFQRGTERTNQQLLTVEKLTIEATFTGLLTKHIARVFLEGARRRFLPLAPAPIGNQRNRTSRSTSYPQPRCHSISFGTMRRDLLSNLSCTNL